MEALEELSTFLSEKARLDLKIAAMENILGITGSPLGIEMLLKFPQILKQLSDLLNNKCRPIVKDAAASLINISANETGATALLHLTNSQQGTDNIIISCLKHVFDKSSTLADPCCMILSNISRPQSNVDEMMTKIEESEFTFDSIMNVFTATKYNSTGANLHYLGPFFSNLSQSPRMRRFLMGGPIKSLLPFTEYSDSVVRRGGIVGTLRNCCFDLESHEFLMSEEIDILTQLLLPLAGPEEFDDEDNSKLPLDLQYLPETKKREQDPDIRQMLLEALTQLCATRKSREIIREKNAYVILRELHKWEKDEGAILKCEHLVNILIRTEEEIGVDDLKKLEVPEEYAEKFDKEEC